MCLSKCVYTKQEAQPKRKLFVLEKKKVFILLLLFYEFAFGLRLVDCTAPAATLVMAMAMADPVVMVMPWTAGGSRSNRKQPEVKQEQQSSKNLKKSAHSQEDGSRTDAN